MDNREIWNRLQGPLGTYGGGWSGVSYADQYRNAKAGLNELNSIYNTVADEGMSQDQYNAFGSALKSQKANALAGSALSILGGGMNILGNSLDIAKIGDTSQYDSAINSYNDVGRYGYTNLNQVADDYKRLGNLGNMSFDYDTIRGGSTGERVGNVLSSTLSGATTGLTVGGPWGALAGAVVGLGAGVGGWVAGNQKAKEAQHNYEVDQQYAMNTGYNNIQGNYQRFMRNNFLTGLKNTWSNTSAEGGPIKRQQSLQEFTASIKKARRNDVTRSARIQRQYVNGGVRIKIKK